jgi:hypothetical protein
MTEPTLQECDQTKDEKPRRGSQAGPSGGAVYALGLIGALVWFWRQADGPGERASGVLKALVWPSFFVYYGFKALQPGSQQGH